MNEVNDFETLYNNSYNILLRFIIVKCDNLSNTKDIIQ